MPPSEPPRDLVETLTALAARLGMNPVRVRWKLLAWQKRIGLAREAAARRVEHARWEHRVCRRCGVVNHRDDRRCTSCGAAFGPRWLERLGRLGIVPAHASAATILLASLILVAEARMLLACGAGALLAPSTACVAALGGNQAIQVALGEWWRLATAMFLHIGLLHLGFNLMALAQVGPAVEEVFGAGRMLLLYVVSGLAGNWLSVRHGHYGVSAGASGAIMGLIGVAAGWGQRDGTTVGRTVRNQMLRWAAFTMAFGLIAPVDNWAHGGGFVAGAVLGYAARPSWLRRRGPGGLDTALGLAGLLPAVAAVAMILFGTTAPPPLPAIAPGTGDLPEAVAPPRPPPALPPFDDPADLATAARLLQRWTGSDPHPLDLPLSSAHPERSEAESKGRGDAGAALAGHRFEAAEEVAEAILAQAQDRLLARGLFVVRLEHHHGLSRDVVGLFPTRDPFQVIAWAGTDGVNHGHSNADVIAWLRELHRTHPFRLTGAGLDFIEARFLGPIADPEALAREIYRFCPDVVEQGTRDVATLAEELRRSQTLFLWWD